MAVIVKRVMSSGGHYIAWSGRVVKYRSEFERKYMVYLDLLQRGGVIKDWLYEPEEFWFLTIKRGVRSYRPDFQVTLADGSIEWHETKGYLDSKSKTKIERFGIYYPENPLVLVMQSMPNGRSSSQVKTRERIESLRSRIERNGGRIVAAKEIMRIA